MLLGFIWQDIKSHGKQLSDVRRGNITQRITRYECGCIIYSEFAFRLLLVVIKNVWITDVRWFSVRCHGWNVTSRVIQDPTELVSSVQATLLVGNLC